MQVELIVNCAANGEMILAEQAGAYPAPEEAGGMCFARAAACGNLILGRTSYEMFAPVLAQVLAGAEIVVLTTKDDLPGVTTAKSPEEAVRCLESRGFARACVGGGAKTNNAFLAAGLADELSFNYFPVVIGGGAVLETVPGKALSGYTLDYVKSCGDTAMLHWVR